MSAICYADDKEPIDPNVYVLAHNMIDIESYDAKTHIFHIKRKGYPTANELFATGANLAKAVPTIAKVIRDNPESIVGRIFSTDVDLRLVAPKSVPSKKK